MWSLFFLESEQAFFTNSYSLDEQLEFFEEIDGFGSDMVDKLFTVDA